MAQDVLSTIPNEIIVEGFKNLPQHIYPGNSVSIPLALKKANFQPTLQTEFLLGEEPTWSDVSSGRAIKTIFDEKLESKVSKRLTQNKPKHILLTGPAGCGKSTSLMRIALKLHAEGKNVFWIDRNIEIAPNKILDFLVSETDIDVLVIDDSDLYGTKLSDIILETNNLDTNPLILLEMRSIAIDRCLNGSRLGNFNA